MNQCKYCGEFCDCQSVFCYSCFSELKRDDIDDEDDDYEYDGSEMSIPAM